MTHFPLISPRHHVALSKTEEKARLAAAEAEAAKTEAKNAKEELATTKEQKKNAGKIKTENLVDFQLAQEEIEEDLAAREEGIIPKGTPGAEEGMISPEEAGGGAPAGEEGAVAGGEQSEPPLELPGGEIEPLEEPEELTAPRTERSTGGVWAGGSPPGPEHGSRENPKYKPAGARPKQAHGQFPKAGGRGVDAEAAAEGGAVRPPPPAREVEGESVMPAPGTLVGQEGGEALSPGSKPPPPAKEIPSGENVPPMPPPGERVVGVVHKPVIPGQYVSSHNEHEAPSPQPQPAAPGRPQEQSPAETAEQQQLPAPRGPQHHHHRPTPKPQEEQPPIAGFNMHDLQQQRVNPLPSHPTISRENELASNLLPYQVALGAIDDGTVEASTHPVIAFERWVVSGPVFDGESAIWLLFLGGQLTFWLVLSFCLFNCAFGGIKSEEREMLAIGATGENVGEWDNKTNQSWLKTIITH